VTRHQSNGVVPASAQLDGLQVELCRAGRIWLSTVQGKGKGKSKGKGQGRVRARVGHEAGAGAGAGAEVGAGTGAGTGAGAGAEVALFLLQTKGGMTEPNMTCVSTCDFNNWLGTACERVVKLV